MHTHISGGWCTGKQNHIEQPFGEANQNKHGKQRKKPIKQTHKSFVFFYCGIAFYFIPPCHLTLAPGQKYLYVFVDMCLPQKSPKHRQRRQHKFRCNRSSYIQLAPGPWVDHTKTIIPKLHALICWKRPNCKWYARFGTSCVASVGNSFSPLLSAFNA